MRRTRQAYALPRVRGEAVLDFFLAAERIDLDDRAWLEGISQVSRPLLPASDDHAAAFGSYDAETASWTFATRLKHSGLPLVMDDTLNVELSESERETASTLSGISSVSEHVHGYPSVRSAMNRRGLVEIANVLARTRTEFVALYVHLDMPLHLTAEQRCFWRRLSAHLASTTHLRRALQARQAEQPDAVFRPDGSCAHVNGAFARASLRRIAAQVVARERIRARTGDIAAAVETWTAATIAGWSVIDRFDDDGRHWILAWENPLGEHNPRRLSPTELQLVERVVQGWTNRDIAAELGSSRASTSRMLHRALRKLGVDDVGVLARWHSPSVQRRVLAQPIGIDGLLAIGIPLPAAERIQGLTNAEREVLAGLVGGKTNREIGSARGTSARTVANQVQSIFAKLGVGSRRELLHGLGDRFA